VSYRHKHTPHARTRHDYVITYFLELVTVG